jgi:hypothetical protein
MDSSGGGICQEAERPCRVCLQRMERIFLLVSQTTRLEQTILLNLKEKRENRHKESNRLEDLLEVFQYTQCSEPRDKIYGFLGLSHDCQASGSLQVDYSMSLFQLYVEVVMFFCRSKLLRNGSTNDLDRSMRVVRFSQMVLGLLGNPERESERLLITSDPIQASGAIGGPILTLGPTYNEMISSYNETKELKLCFESCYYRPQDIQRLMEGYESYEPVLYI